MNLEYDAPSERAVLGALEYGARSEGRPCKRDGS